MKDNQSGHLIRYGVMDTIDVRREKTKTAHRIFLRLQESTGDYLPRSRATGEERRRQKQQAALDLWLHVYCRPLVSVLTGTRRRDHELHWFDTEAGTPGLFEKIRGRIRQVESEMTHARIPARLADRNRDIFLEEAEQVERDGKEDIGLLLRVIAREIEENPRP
jgi:hypothetical protein